MSLEKVRQDWEAIAVSWIPRILTQLDREPTSSTYGCADRDWWHYKIRDFPSIILQQAGYTVWLASALPPFRHQAEGLRQLAAGSAQFWSIRAQRRGAFEEYYPNEQAYPPLAFSTLAMVRLVAEGVVGAETIRGGMRNAATQLIGRFESEAANQQVAGLAALSWIQKLYPDLVTAEQVEQVTRDTLALQTDEGWYQEYGGPDLGYLSVTLDCLWDAYDASGDDRILRSAEAALGYLEAMASFSGAKIGLLFSRNTDYVLPYGISRFCRYPDGRGERAERLLNLIYADASRPDHFLHAIDDRYISHYAGHSLLRAIGELASHDAGAAASRRRNRSSASAPDAGDTASERYFALSGHFIRVPNSGPAIIVALKKGGVATLRAPDGSLASDFGWSIPAKGGRIVSHWWSDEWRAERLENGWRISGLLVLSQEHISKPWKHAALRAASWLIGRHLKRLLKRALILNPRRSAWTFERSITWHADKVMIRDSIKDLPVEMTPEPAPRTSRRYVPSANNFHPDDFELVQPPWMVERIISRENGGWTAETNYSYRFTPLG